ncbi:MAG TPA: VWA domain-containing protein [Candidatus Acidoferrales bacterium]|nr:VWA domain-containing protein [Candidatus Acidoferrales bacterium]
MSINISAWALCLASLCPFLAAPTLAQSKPEDPKEVTIRYGVYRPHPATISMESSLVELRVAVRDSKGRPVAGLTASDFEIFDNGKPQQAAFFSEEKSAARPEPISAAPAGKQPAAGAATPPSAVPAAGVPGGRSIALFIDDTHGEPRSLQQSMRAAEAFVSTGMQPGDRVAIFTDSGDVTLDFTTDAKALLAAIGRLSTHPQRGAHGGLSVCPTLTSYQAYVIANNLDLHAMEVAVAEATACNCPPGSDPNCSLQQEDLVQETAVAVWDQTRNQSTTALDVLKITVQHLATMPGDRILVILSPGFATGDAQQQTSAILDAALRARIVINSIDSEGLINPAYESPEGNRVDQVVREQVLPELMSGAAAATGGQFIMNDNDIKGSLQAMTSVPEVSYLLGFAPSARPDDEYHKLKVKLAIAGDYKVQSRAGYFSAVLRKEPETAQQRIDREAFSNQQLEQISLAVRVSHGKAKNGQATIVVNVGVDARQLKFEKRSGRNIQELTFVTLLEDCAGHYIAGKQGVMDFYLKPASLAIVQSQGIHATLAFLAPKGPYQVREVVREAVQDRLAASNTPAECH